MLSARTRALALATLLATGGTFVAAAAPAQAAPGATIEVDSDFAFTDEPLGVWGECPTTAGSAVVSLTQGGEATATESSDVDPTDGYFEVSLDLAKAAAGAATVTVDCFAYDQPAPLASASTDIMVVDFDFDFDQIDVSLSARTVALGGSLRVSATCPKDSAKAVVMVGNAEAEEPFFTREVAPAADGRVSVDVPIAKSDASAPQTGDAVAVVLCGSEFDASLLAAAGIEGLADTDLLPTAMGFAEFTITPAVARSAVPVSTTTPPRELANTGSDNGPLAAIALALIATGAGALRLSRRV